MALSLTPDREIIVGTSCGLSASLSTTVMGYSFFRLEAVRSVRKTYD
jgi:hypothetical protein